MLWSVSPTGECCCPRGSSRRQERGFYALGTTTHCGGSGPGKHPWSDGQRGYVHGALDADESPEAAIAKWGPLGGARRWAVTLGNVMVIDLDGPQAVLSFARLCHHVPDDKILGVAKTPRGWHVYLDCPGWNQRALNQKMKAWLGDWHGTDRTKISRSGLLLDIRTGPTRYVVWPEDSGQPQRRWARADEIRTALIWRRHGMRPSLIVPDGSKAPWNLPVTPELTAEIEQAATYAPRPDGITETGHVRGGMTYATQELTRWCGKLAQMPPDSGRNSMLNKIAYFAGTRAIKAGMSREEVVGKLRRAALRSGLSSGEIDVTINSGLSSGLAAVA